MAQPSADDPRFRLTDEQARALASEFGTPLYVIDEQGFRARCRRFVSALKESWPGGRIAFASKANSTLAVLQIAHEEGCLIDVASEGELRAALAAGIPAEDCHLHGNAKSLAELQFAIESGIGKIVVDSFEEIAMLAGFKALPPLVLRLAPGVDPKTHAKISTGQADTKFGFNIADGSAERALAQCLEQGMPVVGVHCHVGSQLLDPEAQISGGEIIADFSRAMHERHGWKPDVLNVGGGLGVVYTGDETPMEVEPYFQRVAEAVEGALGGKEVLLMHEPGRSLIAESGVTLYSVAVVKQLADKRYISIDGGLADNPRPALYGARYAAEIIPGSPRAATAPEPAWISGRHCETDLLIPEISLPGHIEKGDLLQMLTTGAYGSSMASNYNRYPRPATVLLRKDGPVLVQRREAHDEMLAREVTI